MCYNVYGDVMNETIGRNIKILREANNMSQQELAEKLFITRQSVSKWESGMVVPDIEKLQMISKLFKIKIDDLMKDNFNYHKKHCKIIPFFLIVSLITFIVLFLLTFSYLGIVYYLDVN